MITNMDNNDNNTSTQPINKKNRTEYFRQYRIKNVEKLKENNKRYYEKQKNNLHTCDVCNCQIKGTTSFLRHNWSKKHMKNLYLPKVLIMPQEN